MSNLNDQLKGIFSSIGGGSSGLTGIDVGMSGIKVCEIDKTGNQYLLKSFGYAPLSEGVIVDGDFHKKELLIEAIKNAFSQGEIKNKNVCYGFPSQNTVIKKMHAPNGSKQEIEDHSMPRRPLQKTTPGPFQTSIARASARDYQIRFGAWSCQV